MICLKSHLLLAELLLAAAVGSAQGSARGWFAGWDGRTVLCALGWVPSAWMSTVITTRFSSVVKNVMQCVATMATYFLEPSERRTTPCTLVALVISLTVVAFSLQSPSPEAHDKADGASTGDVHESELLVALAGRERRPLRLRFGLA